MKKILVLLSIALLASCQQQTYDRIIRNATVYDGSGSAPVKADVGILGDTIAFVGDLSKAKATETIDANGLALSPGFIDAHSHHDRGLEDSREALAVVSQGITTIVVGQDGGSDTPLRNYFQHLTDSPAAVNVAAYSGHNTIRDHVMGEDFKRHATPEEVDKMVKWLRDDMEAGALGLSTGLEYDPGIYSHKEEVLTLAKVLPEYNGRYISHLRSEDRYFWDAVQEIIEIGRVTKVPVQISHFKLAMRGLWGKADSTLQLLDKARAEGIDITADIYPYAYWSSTIRVLFPDRNFNDLKEAEFILREVTTPEGIIFSSYTPNPEYNGKSLAEAAAIEKKAPAKMLIELIQRLDACDKTSDDCHGSIVATSMDESDIQKLMQWAHTGICSDGASSGRHPRGFGAFTRVLRKYVREDKALSLEQAIHKMTYLTAQNIGIEKRGLIKVGYYADLVMFDPATVSDQATIAEPQKQSTGIERVWVNGTEVFALGKTSGQFPGDVIRRKNWVER
ncbi:MAG: N-acyl-D-amino-acid deacylase family protein [Bacteroidota bacterium]